jgi:hypothetical protein
MAASKFSLGAAMRVCCQAEASSPAREFRLLDRVTIDRATAGQQILVRMDGIPATDSRGRIAHVRGLYIRAEADITLAAANDIVTAYRLRSIFPSTFLRDFTGWTYWSDLDARTFLDDQFFRYGSHVQWPALQQGIQAVSLIGAPIPSSTVSGDAGIGLNLGAGDIVRDVSVYMPLVNPGKNPLQGLIPLATLQRVSNNALTIRVGTQFQGAPTGVTFNNLQVQDTIDGVTRQGCDIWADIVWLSGLVTDAPWQLDEYTLTELSGVLLNPERITQYAAIRHFPEDAAAQAGQLQVELYDGISLTVGGFNLMPGMRIDDVVERGYLNTMARHAASQARSNAAQSLPMGDATGQLALSLLPYRNRQQAAAGPIVFEYQTRGAQTFTRYVTYTVGAHTAERGKLVEQRLAHGPCQHMGTDHQGVPQRAVQAYQPTISIPVRSRRQLKQSRGL